MAIMTRRSVVAAAGATLAAGLAPRKLRAETLAEDLTLIDPPAVIPDGVFLDAGGGEHRLSEFRGHGMVVNLWATWCAPCVAEMPSLALLSKALAPSDIAVLPLSSDRGGAAVVQAWFAAHGIASLPVLLDPKGALAHAWQARGIPTTVLIGRDGRARARLEGATDWGTPAAAETVRRIVSAGAG